MGYGTNHLANRAFHRKLSPPAEVKESQPLLKLSDKLSNHRRGVAKYVRRPHSKPLLESEKDCYGGYALDPNGPTDYPPGSDGKILVMQDRAARRVALHHPLDRKEQ